jgi:glycosyltransferase involved in cell wall biosynthesis
MDLINNQINRGIQVSLLYPGEIRLLRKRITIKHSSGYKGAKVYRLVNPLPIPLIYAIDSDRHYINYDKKINFINFFKENKIDVVHLHTLMGLPIEFLEQAKQSGIKLVYTAHDTFGVWPEPQLDNDKNTIDRLFNRGFIGNQYALPYTTIIFMQSRIYEVFKTTKAVQLLKSVSSFMRGALFKNRSVNTVVQSTLNNASLYVHMRSRYKMFFELIDLIHYNSSLTRDIFSSYGILKASVVLPVYHSYLPTRPTELANSTGFDGSKNVTILYNGTREEYKGYNLLLEVLDEIYREGTDNFEVIMYGSGKPARAYIRILESYRMDSLETVYAGIDVTIVPSLYFETYGMVVAESLSFGVPVILSKNVGAKSLIKGYDFGSEFQSRDALKKRIERVLKKPEILSNQKKAILSSTELVFDSSAVYEKVLKLYVKDILV